MEKAEEKKVLKNVADTILQEGIDFYVDLNRLNILHRIGLRPKSVKYIIKPLYLGTLIRISKLMVDISLPEKIKQEDWNMKGIEMISKHSELLVDVLALAIHNRPGQPSNKTKRTILNNCTPEEIYAILTFVLHQMDVANFMKSIISIKGMSLIEREETIASGHS